MCTCVERQWNGKELVDIAVGTLLEDPETKSIGVAAGDFDGDGQEEVKSNQHLGFMQHKFIPCCVVDVCFVCAAVICLEHGHISRAKKSYRSIV